MAWSRRRFLHTSGSVIVAAAAPVSLGANPNSIRRNRDA